MVVLNLFLNNHWSASSFELAYSKFFSLIKFFCNLILSCKYPYFALKLNIFIFMFTARSSITAALSPPLSVTPGGNASFYCEFYIDEVDKSLYDTVTVGLWELGSVYRTLSTLTKHSNLIMNPKLHQEAPEYHERVHASYLSNKTSNTSVISVVLLNVEVSDARSYGCSMDFGPFKEPVGTSVRIEVQGKITLTNLLE